LAAQLGQNRKRLFRCHPERRSLFGNDVIRIRRTHRCQSQRTTLAHTRRMDATIHAAGKSSTILAIATLLIESTNENAKQTK
jgi:hypothetical protein